MENIELLIAGQGAAAFSSALYAGRYRMKTVVVAEQFGGETAIGGLIENYPGAPNIDGFELMLKFKEQIADLQVPVISADLQDIKQHNGEFICTLTDGKVYSAMSVVLAIGRTRRTLGLKNEEEWIGRGISYCSTCDAPLYRNKLSAAVVGGGNAAVEGAILLAKYVPTVYLVYRGESLFRPEPILIHTLDATKQIRKLLKTQVIELQGDDSGLTHIKIDRPYQDTDTLKIDGLFIEAGADPKTAIPKRLGMKIDSSTGEVDVDKHQRTSIPGIFAAGDLTNASALKQTVTAASQGAISALSAYQHVISQRATQRTNFLST